MVQRFGASPLSSSFSGTFAKECFDQSEVLFTSPWSTVAAAPHASPFDQNLLRRAWTARKVARTRAQTTVIVRNVPPEYTQEMLRDQWPQSLYGFDFFHLDTTGPERKPTVCINFLGEGLGSDFLDAWNKRRLPLFNSRKALRIVYGAMHGRDAHVIAAWRKRNYDTDQCVGWLPVVYKGETVVPFDDAVRNVHTSLTL